MNVLENSIDKAIANLRTEELNMGLAIHLTPTESILLAAMYGNILYTYEIIDLVPVKSDGRKLVKQGTIYPTISLMRKKGLIKGTRNKRNDDNLLRVYYSVTEKGKASLFSHLIDLLTLFNT